MSFIKIDRRIFNHWVFDDPWSFKAWIDLIGMANFERSNFAINGRMFNVERGELIRSGQTLARRWNCSVCKVRKFLSMLEGDGMVVIKSELLATRIKIAQYEDYQGFDEKPKTEKVREKNAEKTQKKSYKERKKLFIDLLGVFVTDENRSMCNEFFLYWTETSLNSDKMRFEMEKAFDMKRRLGTWEKNQNKFQKHESRPDDSNDLYANVMKQINGTGTR
jgi:hypothetical protein